jgi:hypothetical protein
MVKKALLHPVIGASSFPPREASSGNPEARGPAGDWIPADALSRSRE